MRRRAKTPPMRPTPISPTEEKSRIRIVLLKNRRSDAARRRSRVELGVPGSGEAGSLVRGDHAPTQRASATAIRTEPAFPGARSARRGPASFNVGASEALVIAAKLGFCCPLGTTEGKRMINAAMVGLGRWGQTILASVQGKSERLRIVHGVSKEPDLARPLAERYGFRLSTDLRDALADPDVEAVFLATPHSLHVEQVRRGRARRQAGLVREAARAHAGAGGALRRGVPPRGRSPRDGEQQALLRVDARTRARRPRGADRRGSSRRGSLFQRAQHARRGRLARRPERVARRGHDGGGAARPRTPSSISRAPSRRSTPARSAASRPPIRATWWRRSSPSRAAPRV